jgi:hypothetical protein
VVAELAEIAVPLDRLPRKHLDGSLTGSGRSWVCGVVVGLL